MADINSSLPVRTQADGDVVIKLSDGTRTATVRDTGSNDSLNVAITDASGNHVTSFGGGTQYAEDAAFGGNGTGTLMIARRDDALATLTPVEDDAVGLRVNSLGALWVINSDTAVQIDDAAFTPGTSRILMIGGEFDNTGTDSIDEGDGGAIRISGNRNVYMQIRDGAGNERGANVDAANNLNVIAASNSGVDIGDVTINNASGGSAVNIQDGGNSITIDGAVTITEAQISTEVQDYDTSASISAAASDNHDYTVGNTALLLKSITVAASGKMKVTLQVGPVASLVTKGVWFTSTANPSLQITFPQPIEVPSTSTGTVRIIRTNLEGSAMDVYSTINGREV